jgi:hypothetical protein
MQESTVVSPDFRRFWLCEGRLLQLYDAISTHNIALFQYQWPRGKPVNLLVYVGIQNATDANENIKLVLE